MRKIKAWCNKSMKQAVILSIIGMSCGVAAACCVITATTCPQKHGACTLIDDTDEYDVQTTADSGFRTCSVTRTDACGYQCGTEFHGYGNFITGTNSCP